MFAIQNYLKLSALRITRRGRRWRRFQAMLGCVGVFRLQNQYVVNLFYFDYLQGRRHKRGLRLHRRLDRLWGVTHTFPVASTANYQLRAPFDLELLTEATAVLNRTINRFNYRRAAAARVWGRTRSCTLGYPTVLRWCRLHLKENRVREVQSSLKYRLRGRFQRRIKAIVFPLMKRLRKSRKVVGARFRCHGRFDRQQRAQHKSIQWGALGTGDPSQIKETTFVTVPLRFGAVGITLTVNYGNVADSV